jgi:uncharacterized phage protein (TIGR02220 family)
MAERRMFAKTIIDSDAFLEMPLSTQSLYFHLSMRADDDGFVNNPKKIQRMIGASDDDCRLLIHKRFVLAFDSGIIVIKHWKINNYLRSDRYKETVYTEEKAMLELEDNNAYTEKPLMDTKGIPNGIPNGYQRYTQYSIGKVSIDKYNNTMSSNVDKIVSYLNEKAGTHYKKVDSTTRLIKARLQDYSVEEMKKVIDSKVGEWKGTEMQKYLRPETLFNATKFESYLNGLQGAKTSKTSDFNASDSKVNADEYLTNIDNFLGGSNG